MFLWDSRYSSLFHTHFLSTASSNFTQSIIHALQHRLFRSQ
jgi:hypothetical protein